MSEPTTPSPERGSPDPPTPVEPLPVPASAPYSAPSWHTPRLLIAWAIAILCGVLAVLLAPAATRVQWLALAVGFCTLATFALQLGTAQREGFITRTSFSVAGCVLIIAIVHSASVLVG